ncbi:unnamed protein product, partial [marine sediment metagenome]
MSELKRRVLVAGTFDLIHAGHIYLINEASKLGDVYVVVATDDNREIFSGERPIIPQEQRLEIIKNFIEDRLIDYGAILIETPIMYTVKNKKLTAQTA